MDYQIFSEEEQNCYPIVILSKPSTLSKSFNQKYYLDSLTSHTQPEDFIAIGLEQSSSNKPSASLMNQFLKEELIPSLDQIKAKYLIITDANYFKKITGYNKVAGAFGYVVDGKYEGTEHLKCIYVPSYSTLVYKPEDQDKITNGLSALKNYLDGKYVDPGKNIVHSAKYLSDLSEIKKELDRLLTYPMLSCDIETFSLEFHKAGIATIGFSWSEHEGTCIQCDYQESDEEENLYGKQIDNHEVKQLLRDFFDAAHKKGITFIYHNGSFDAKILIYELYMAHLLDRTGMIQGVKTLGVNLEDTKILTYVCTNSASRNELGLKANTQAFTGDYEQTGDDIKDIRRIPLKELMIYNLKDCLATFWLYKKRIKQLIEEDQQTVYRTILLPSVKLFLQVELTGMPIDMDAVDRAEAAVGGILKQAYKTLEDSSLVQDFTWLLREEEMKKRNAKLKKLVKTIEDFSHIEFNPNSDNQKRLLLFTYLKKEPISFTKKGRKPSTDGDTIKVFHKLADDPKEKEVFAALKDIADAAVIYQNFITTFKEKSIKKSDGHHYLHGNFNIGGTVSGRLSSSQP